MKLIAKNRRAARDYFIEERYEAGIVLKGSEIKSVRGGKVSFGDSHVDYKDGEMWLVGLHISEYKFAATFGHDPLRPRKLLLNAHEIQKIGKKLETRGFTAVPLSIYLKNGKAKVELGLARGKKQTDKRQAIRQRDEDRQAQREFRERNR